MKKKDIAKMYFKIEPRTLRNWINKGVPSCRVDNVGNILIRRARNHGCQIQGTPHQIKCGIKKPEYFGKCLEMSFPGIELKQ